MSKSRRIAALLAALFTFPAVADETPPAHEHGDSPDAGGMHSMPGMSMSMPSALGPYGMTREGSGTSWQPEATPMDGIMLHGENWMTMVHGFANLSYDHQGGPRGDGKSFTTSMLMIMGSRHLGAGTLGLRGMFSLDPTIGKSGYPLLFQTGETANGVTPLVDRQHPHDALMELAASYSVPMGETGAVFGYAGLPGEPALGPPAFMHRFSGVRNPEAPLTHHWLDSTHITFGVATLGASYGPWKVEGSLFNGREPDQYRWNIETGRFDSSSARVSFNPTSNWSFQVSYGRLKQPEQLEPDVDVNRTTASAIHQSMLAGRRWGTTLAWGRNDKHGSHGASRKLDGWLLESTLELSDHHTVFGRLERVNNDELFPEGSSLHGQAVKVDKLSVGYVYDFAKTGPVRWGVGALGSVYRSPAELDQSYGTHPRSYMVFLQAHL